MNGLTQRVLCPCHHHGQIMFVCTAEGGKRNVTRHCPVAFNARSEPRRVSLQLGAILTLAAGMLSVFTMMWKGSQQ
jgi:hypothetical protein